MKLTAPARVFPNVQPWYLTTSLLHAFGPIHVASDPGELLNELRAVALNLPRSSRVRGWMSR